MGIGVGVGVGVVVGVIVLLEEEVCRLVIVMCCVR